MIETPPVPTKENMREYAVMLLVRYIQPPYTAGVLQVHVLFDNPGGLKESPKLLGTKKTGLRQRKRISTSSVHNIH